LYSSTTLLSSHNERASHPLLHQRVLHQDKSIRTSTLRAVTTYHNKEKEKKRKEKNLQSSLTIRFQIKKK
jgi:hypothetical protein